MVRLRLCLLWLSLLLLCACKKSPELEQQAPPAPPPAPTDLWIEGGARAPDTTWRNVQQGVAGLATLLPSTAFGLLAVQGGLEVKLGDLVDGGRPVVFAVAGSPLNPSWVVVATAREKRLVEGRFPSRSPARALPGSAITLERLPLEHPSALPGEAPPFLVYLSSRGDLLIASAEPAVDTLAAYAMFGLLPRADWAAHDLTALVPPQALPSLALLLTHAWGERSAGLLQRANEDRSARGGREPDYGDPAAILEGASAIVAASSQLLTDTERIRLTYDADKTESKLELQVLPKQGGAWGPIVASMQEGSGARLANEPVGTKVAWLSYATPAARAERAEWVGARLGETLGTRISAASRANLSKALVTLTRSLGPVFRWRLEGEPLRLDVQGAPAGADSTQAVAEGRAAMGELVSLMQRESKLRGFLRIARVEGPKSMRAGKDNTDSAPPLRSLFFENDPSKGAGKTGTSLALYTREKDGQLSHSLERAPVLDLLSELPGDAPWLQNVRPELGRRLADLGNRSMFFAVFGSSPQKGAAEASAVLIGIGKREGALSMQLSVPHRFGRELPSLPWRELLP